MSITLAVPKRAIQRAEVAQAVPPAARARDRADFRGHVDEPCAVSPAPLTYRLDAPAGVTLAPSSESSPCVQNDTKLTLDSFSHPKAIQKVGQGIADIGHKAREQPVSGPERLRPRLVAPVLSGVPGTEAVLGGPRAVLASAAGAGLGGDDFLRCGHDRAVPRPSPGHVSRGRRAA